MEKPSVFITGASGFLGRQFLKKADPEAYGRLICLVRQPDRWEKGGCEFVQGDLLNPDSYVKSLAGCDTVLHMAAATGRRQSHIYFRDNAAGTRSLLDACRRSGVRNVLYVSTIAVNIPDTADYPYAESKRQAEEAVRSSGLKHTIVRPTIVIGKDSPVLEGLRRLALAPVLPLFGKGSTHIQPIDVEDLSDQIHGILQESWFENRVLELGGPEVIEMELFLKRIRVGAGKKPGPVVHIPAWPLKPLLGVLERIIPGALPVTRGQLKALTSDGTARPDERTERRRKGMKGIDEMLRSARA